MDETIFMLNGEKLEELDEQGFVQETDFQALLERYPKLLPGSQIDPDNPRRWMLVSREVPVPGEEGGAEQWYLDHLFLDQDGIPTLVEVKRSSDTRLRREVVVQMLDYAANSVLYWSIDEIISAFESRCETNGVDPAAAITELTDDADSPNSAYWKTVHTNLQARRVRLLFVADYIPRELARIIEFLNQQMSPAEVLGIELRQFAKDDIRTIVPRVIGRTIASATRKSARATNKWDEESFMEELELRAGPEAVNTVRGVLDALADKVTRFWYGEGAKSGSVVPTLDTSLGFNPLFAIYTYGRFEIYFQHLKSRQPFTDIAKRKHFKDELNRIDGIDISDDQLDKRPSFDVTVLAAHDALARFRDAYFWVIEELRRVAGS